MMELTVTTGAISRAKLTVKLLPQQTITRLFTGQMPFLSPNQQYRSTEGVPLRVRCTSLTKWLTRELTIWLSIDALHETLTLG